MPAHLVHIQLAQTLLDPSHGFEVPSWAEDPEAINALYHGAIGPDAGYFPGADGLLAALAHHLRPVALAREILAQAVSPIQEAYAWGWITHLLGDGELHPWVNRAAGLLYFPDRDRPSTPADSVAAHARVEVGLDARRMSQAPGTERIRLRPAFDTESVAFVADAYRRAYALDPGESVLLEAHRAVVRYQPWIFRLTGLVARKRMGFGVGLRHLVLMPPYLVLRGVSGLVARDSLVYGATHPVPPSDRLEQEVGAFLESLPARFHHHLATGLTQFSEIDLDTGEPEDPQHPYPSAEAARQELGRRLGAKAG